MLSKPKIIKREYLSETILAIPALYNIKKLHVQIVNYVKIRKSIGTKFI